jgi:hypothetical protein
MSCEFPDNKPYFKRKELKKWKIEY